MAWPIFRGLFDDASLFPPASLPMADAVAGHLRHRAAWYREMSGPFVCADTKITELSAALTAAGVADRDAARVSAKIRNLDAETVSAVRSLFTSFGTCSTDEPINDLITLGLVSKD